jgi:hypothetical protein
LNIKSLFLFSYFLGSASSGNPNLFPRNLTNYYTNVFNPNVNTQFLQNANPPNTYFYPNFQQQQQQFLGPMSTGGIGIPVSSIFSHPKNTMTDDIRLTFFYRVKIN